MTIRTTYPGIFARAIPFGPNDGDEGGDGVVRDEIGVLEPQEGDYEPEEGADTQEAADDTQEAADEGGDAGGEAADDVVDEADPVDPDDDGQEAPAEPPKKDWKARQIIKAREAAKAADERAAAAEKRAAALEELYAQPEGERTSETLITREEAVRIAREELTREQTIAKINTGADEMFEKGASAYPKSWNQRVNEAAEVFGDEMRAKPSFLGTLVKLSNSADVYHELAGDPDRMERVLAMSDADMGVELALMSAKLAAPKPKPISRVPPPIVPLDPRGNEEKPLDDLLNDPNASMDEIDRRMRAEEKRQMANQR